MIHVDFFLNIAMHLCIFCAFSAKNHFPSNRRIFIVSRTYPIKTPSIFTAFGLQRKEIEIRARNSSFSFLLHIFSTNIYSPIFHYISLGRTIPRYFIKPDPGQQLVNAPSVHTFKFCAGSRVSDRNLRNLERRKYPWKREKKRKREWERSAAGTRLRAIHIARRLSAILRKGPGTGNTNLSNAHNVAGACRLAFMFLCSFRRPWYASLLLSRSYYRVSSWSLSLYSFSLFPSIVYIHIRSISLSPCSRPFWIFLSLAAPSTPIFRRAYAISFFLTSPPPSFSISLSLATRSTPASLSLFLSIAWTLPTRRKGTSWKVRTLRRPLDRSLPLSRDDVPRRPATRSRSLENTPFSPSVFRPLARPPLLGPNPCLQREAGVARSAFRCFLHRPDRATILPKALCWFPD